LAIGLTALARVATGTNNIAIGSSAGATLTLADSSNIMISNHGTAGNSNTIKIGTQGAGAGQQDATYIAGITGTATGVTTEIVQIDSTGKLGTISATTINLSADATATTVNLATGAAAKVVTLGSTNGASSLALRYGTADFTLASVTGTVMSALDTGEITKPLQPCFMAFNSATDADVTGDATVFTLIFDGERYDQNADWDGTSTFTAPVTGKYFFDVHVYTQGIAAGHTAGFIYFVTSNRTYYCWSLNPAAVCAGTGMFTGTVLADMDVGDTCQVKIHIDNSTKVIDIYGAATGEYTNFSGSLVC
jgi:hypothetical protein